MRTLKESILGPGFMGPKMPNFKFKGAIDLFRILKSYKWTLKTSNSGIGNTWFSDESNTDNQFWIQILDWLNKYGEKNKKPQVNNPVFVEKHTHSVFIHIYSKIAKTKQDKHKCLMISGVDGMSSRYPRTAIRDDEHSYWADSRVRTEDEPWESEPQCWVPKEVAIMIMDWLSECTK